MRKEYNKPEPIKIKFCIYARKSSEAEERQALSIDSQIKEMKVIAERDNLEVVCIKIESHSAKNSGQRPVFNEIIKDIKNKKYNALLTWNTDRLSRNAGDLGQIVDLIDHELLVEIRTYGQIFINNPNDKFLLMILGSQAKLENDNRSINVQRGMRAVVEKGLYPGVAPTGYLSSNLRDQLCVKIIDPVRAPIIKEMFQKVGYEGWTNRQLFYWFKDINFKTKSGRVIDRGSIHNILHRTFYYGQFEYPKGSNKWYQGKHTPIITKELFDLVQEVLKQHAKVKNYQRTGRIPYAFIRLMRCGLCGSNIIAQEKMKKQRNGNIHSYVYYYCSSSKDHECKRCYLSERKLIKLFLNLFDSVSIDLIGMHQEMSKDIEKYYHYLSCISEEPMPERSEERKNSDLRGYVKYIFEDGKTEEKLNILKHLKGKLLMRDRKIYVEQ